MTSGKSQRIQVGGKTGSMSQKRKDSPAEKTGNATLHSEPILKQGTEIKPSKKKAKAGGNNKDQERKIGIGDQGKMKEKTLKGTDKEPKKKAGKNSSAPAKWFNNHTARGRWLDGYALQPISFCSMICPNLIEDMYLEVMKKMKKSSIWKVINPGVIGYPRLTRLFYLNLQVVEGDRLAISSRVAGKDIILDHSVFAKVLGCAESYKIDNHPGRKEGVKMAKDEFFYTSHSNPSPCPEQLTRPMLDLEAMILFTILEKCVIPTSEEFLSDKMLYVMHLIMNDYEVDLPELIMEHMLSASTQHTLPYANLLPKFFKHFGISLKNEEKKISEMKMISEMYLEDELFEDEGIEEIFDEENENEETGLMYVIAGGVAGDEMELDTVEIDAGGDTAQGSDAAEDKEEKEDEGNDKTVMAEEEETDKEETEAEETDEVEEEEEEEANEAKESDEAEDDDDA